MKNYQKGFSALLLTGMVFCASQDTSAKAYVGVSAGWNQTVDKATMTNTLTTTTRTIYKVNSGSALGKIFAGYEFQPVGRVLFGAEGFLFLTNLNTRTQVTAAINDTIKAPYGFGASFLMGTPVTDRVDIFGKFNLIARSFDHRITTNGQLLKSESVRVGVGPGLEVKLKLTDCIKLHAETYYTVYRKYNTNTVNDSLTRSYKITSRPSEYGLLVGASYSI